MHHTAIGDGHSAGYEVILKISFVICHDKQAACGGGNGAGVSERRRRSKVAATMELEPKQHNRLDRLKIRKQISTTLLFRSAATLKPIRMECCLPTTAGLAPTMWVNCEPTVWPDTCCSVHYIRVLLQWTKRI